MFLAMDLFKHWKEDLRQVVVILVIMTTIEAVLQKGPYSLIQIIQETAMNVLAAYTVLFLIHKWRERNVNKKQL
jgi:hypothetical protein